MRALRGLVLASVLLSGVSAHAAPRVQHLVALPDTVAITHAGDGSGRLFLTTQDGRVFVHSGGALRPTPYLDIRPLVRWSGEQGLLSIAFHPRYESNGFFFVYYTRQPDGDTVIARYRVSATNPNVADPSSGVTLLVISTPASEVHNGGQLQFGPSGLLYIGMGDGGPTAGTPSCVAQDTSSLLGKMLRIDVDRNATSPPYYGTPPSNPYDGPGKPGRDEIWSLGLRNPWRFSFDRATGDLYIGDVGERRREEIDFEPVGSAGERNYGWRAMEGSLVYEPAGCPGGTPPVGHPSLIPPIIEYPHLDPGSGPVGCAVVGGYRYRGGGVPSMTGAYVFGDWCSDKIWAARRDASGQWTTTVLAPLRYWSVAFGEDEAGELYVTDSLDVYRIEDLDLSAADVSVVEGPATAVSVAQVTVTLSRPVPEPVVIAYGTAAGAATDGADFAGTSGEVTIPAGSTSTVIGVAVLGDDLDEDDETFTVSVVFADGVLGGHVATVTILDDDPLPLVSVDDAVITEGSAGPAPLALSARLSAPSGRAVSVPWWAADGTAAAPLDFEAASGTLAFAPGDVTAEAVVSVIGDQTAEVDEVFFVALGTPTHAVLEDGEAEVMVLDDDAPPLPGPELSHGYDVRHGWLGPRRGARTFRLRQEPLASYEVRVDAVAGALGPVTVERLGADNKAVLQASSGESSAALAWENLLPVGLASQHIRVSARECDGPCAGRDGFRLRFYETTVAAPRFSTAGDQRTVLLLHNRGDVAASGHVYFWSAVGVRLAALPWSAAPRASFSLDTSGVASLAGASGSITITSDAPYGALAGKAVSVDAANGFAFDVPVIPRTR